jgi:hypothetical protein
MTVFDEFPLAWFIFMGGKFDHLMIIKRTSKTSWDYIQKDRWAGAEASYHGIGYPRTTESEATVMSKPVDAVWPFEYAR